MTAHTGLFWGACSSSAKRFWPTLPAPYSHFIRGPSIMQPYSCKAARPRSRRGYFWAVSVVLWPTLCGNARPNHRAGIRRACFRNCISLLLVLIGSVPVLIMDTARAMAHVPALLCTCRRAVHAGQSIINPPAWWVRDALTMMTQTGSHWACTGPHRSPSSAAYLGGSTST